MRRIIILLSLFALLPVLSQAANYPLEVTNIKPANTGNPVLTDTNRIFRAYPGLEYNIRPAVIGGTAPFSYTLGNAPSGMTINSDAGEISWPSPQANSGIITLSVTDAEGTVVHSTWSINVGTTGFYFVDSAAPSGGDGSYNKPWNGWNDFYFGVNDATYNDAIIYFKSGTYTYPSQYIDGTAGSSNRINLFNHPKTYLAYPGHSPFFDGETSTNKIHLHIGGDNYYFDGISFINGYGFSIEITDGDYLTVRRCSFSNLDSSGSASNQAAISFRSDSLHYNNEPPTTFGSFKHYASIQDNIFKDFTINTDGIGLYGVRKCLFSDNVFTRINSVGIRLKSTTLQQFIRDNNFSDNTSEWSIWIQAQYFADETEISHNYLGSGIQIGAYNATMGPGVTHLFRNSIPSKVWFRFIDDGDGQIFVTENSIDNNEASFGFVRDNIGEHYSITANRGVLSGNCFGSNCSIPSTPPPSFAISSPSGFRIVY